MSGTQTIAVDRNIYLAELNSSTITVTINVADRLRIVPDPSINPTATLYCKQGAKLDVQGYLYAQNTVFQGVTGQGQWVGIVIAHASGIPTSYLRSCTFRDATTPIRIDGIASVDLGIATNSGNNVFSTNNGTYYVYNNTANTISAIGNNWGTAVPAQIEARLFDDTDDPTKGRIIFDNPLAAPALNRTVPPLTQLGQNFPNPFNPETWIPFQLSTAATVTIRIYDAKGRLIRTLPLGFQSAGYYTTRQTAAHWDGRNAEGQRVSNGVYFYEIESGSFSAKKKMVVMK